MQSASDLFLGWTEGDAGRHYYVRQLKDMKIKPLIYDTSHKGYHGVGPLLGKAFTVGKQLQP